MRKGREPRGAGGLDRLRRRRGGRGLTVYVVLLVIAMLSAVGIFATKSSSLAVAQAGYFRQMVQTHYVTEYAVHASLSAIATDPPGYVSEFERFDASGDDLTTSSAGDGVFGPHGCRAAGANQRCFKFGIESIETRFGAALFQNSSAVTDGDQLGDAGSLGRSRVDPRFVVEATDLAQVAAPVAGQRQGEGALAFYAVTLSASGQVGPPLGASDQDDALRSTAISLETARVHATLGPIPPR